MDAIERRVAWQTISLAVTFAFAATGSFACDNASVSGLAGEQRERFAFYAFVLWALALLVMIGFSAHNAIEAHRHPKSFP